VFNDEGTIYHIFYGNEEVNNNRTRKYKSGLTPIEAILLCKIMKAKYGIDNIAIEESIPDNLKYLKLPPKTHKSRLTPPWNKGTRNNNKYKTSSVKANEKIKTKKQIWLNNTFKDKSCKYCHESELYCLRYYPDMKKIKLINSNMKISDNRLDLINLINEQDIVCLNCESKLNIGLELI